MCEIGQIRNTQDLPAAIIPVGIKQREIPKVIGKLVNQPYLKAKVCSVVLTPGRGSFRNKPLGKDSVQGTKELERRDPFSEDRLHAITRNAVITGANPVPASISLPGPTPLLAYLFLFHHVKRPQ